MAKILLIETSTALCSAALAEDGKILAQRENPDREHASRLAPMVQEILDEKGLECKDCDAVAVSKGPGSYTGLRVGVSTAKGLCFGAKLPLIAIGSLDVLVWQAIDEKLLPEGCKAIIPMIDARRMEVYTAVFSPDGKQIKETSPMVIDSESFKEELAQGNVLFIGDGAEKCKDVINNPNAHFVKAYPKASAMVSPAFEEYKNERFEDIAYFEPFYLKDFIATVSRKKLF